MIEIRITCLEQEKVDLEKALARTFRLESISPFYPNRGKTEQGRVYIKADMIKEEDI